MIYLHKNGVTIVADKKAKVGYDEVEVLDGYIDAVEELGFDEFMKQYG